MGSKRDSAQEAQEARAALASLVERHQGPLIGYLYRLLDGDRSLAEDLAQETFVRLITAAGGETSRYRSGKPFKPWLYSIATNLARDHFKAAVTRSTLNAGAYACASRGALGTPEKGLTEATDHSPGPEAQAIAREHGAEVAAAIKQLGSEYRAAILLRFYGGMSLQEISIALGVPVGTVKSRLSVGCRKLRDLLAPGDGPVTANNYGSRDENDG